MKNDLVLGYMSPEACGISSRELLKLIRQMDASPNELHGFAAARHGYIFAESYLQPYARDIPHTCHSFGKSYTCTAVGIACTEGLLSPEDRIVDLFADEIRRFGTNPDDGMKSLRLRHLMSMSTGMEKMPQMDEFWIENFLREPVCHTPGKVFLYNSTGSCLLGAAVEKVTGMSLRKYLQQRLFDYIGIGPNDLVWRRFENGICAEPGISATTGANLRLGLFYLAGGCAGGRQIVSSQWMKDATSVQIVPGDGLRTHDGNNGYGWQLWMCKPQTIMRFDGGQGQLCLFDTEHDMAISVHQGGWHPAGVTEMTRIMKEFMLKVSDEPLPKDPDGCRELKAYLDSRELPRAENRPLPAGADAFGGTYRVTEGTFNPWIEVAPEQDDFYHLFYDPSFCAAVNVFSIHLDNRGIVLLCNGRSEIRASLDGTWIRHFAPTPLGELGDYAAAAYFASKDELHISLKWLNGWCSPHITLKCIGSADMEIIVSKDMLHEGRAPVEQRCRAHAVR